MDGFVEDFGNAESGASKTYPVQCSALRKNGHVVLKGHACKIVDMTTSKTGKHGHAKVHLTGIDIFTGKKYEDICPSTHNMDVPHVFRKDYTVLDFDDSYVSLMADDGSTREDLKVSDKDLCHDIVKKLEHGEDVVLTVVKAMDTEQIMSNKGAINK